MINAYGQPQWTYQAPRWRTVLLHGRPLRLFWPHLAFHREAAGSGMLPLHAFALEGPVATKEELVDKLRYFPFTAFTQRSLDDGYGAVQDMSHIDSHGRVCFNPEAITLMGQGNDTLDVFWNSGFSVFNAETLRAWRAATEEEVVALRPFPKQRLPADVHGYASRLQFSSAWWRLPGEARGDDALVAQA